MINATLQWLETSYCAVAIRQSLWLYPTLEIIHIAGIVLLVGPAIMFDLSLLGFSKNVSVVNLSQYLLPWSRRGLLLIIPSGILLFITNAATLFYSPVFIIKMLLLVVAGVNAFIFHRFFIQLYYNGNVNTTKHFAPKLIAGLSLLLWFFIIVCGRLLAY